LQKYEAGNSMQEGNNNTSGTLFTSGMKAAEVSTASGPAESARKSATVE
jgi:hypothetical protein